MITRVKRVAMLGTAFALQMIGIPTALAADVTIDRPSSAPSIPTTNIAEVIKGFINLIFIVAFLIAFFMLIFGGVKWILSGGDKGATQGARDMITAALIGVAIIALSYLLINLLQMFFGIKILQFDLPKISQ